MDDFETPLWRDLREHNGLAGFDDVWDLSGDWVEPPNTRHGGFGAVARCELKRPNDGRTAYYIKVHRNRLKRGALRPWKRTPALDREFANHRRCAVAGVASPAPLYYANRYRDGEHRGVLVTEELADHRSLRSLLGDWQSNGCPPVEERWPLIDAIARRLRALHDAGLVVRSFTPQHIFVNRRGALDGEGVMLIDLERIRATIFRRRARTADLVTLWLATRSVPGAEDPRPPEPLRARLDPLRPDLRRADELRFLESYLGCDPGAPEATTLWRQVQIAAVKKAAERSLAHRPAQSSAKGV